MSLTASIVGGSKWAHAFLVMLGLENYQYRRHVPVTWGLTESKSATSWNQFWGHVANAVPYLNKGLNGQFSRR